MCSFNSSLNICIETILENIEESLGLKVNQENSNNIRFADDTVVMADLEKDFQSLLDIVVIESELKR